MPLSADEYIEELRKRLEGEGFTIMDEPMVGVYALQLVAYNIDNPVISGLRKYYSATFLRIVLVTAMNPIQSEQVVDFSSTVTKRVLEEWREHKLDVGYGTHCFPVVVADSLNEELKKWIQGYVAPKHWLADEFPVLVSLADQELYFCEKTPMWGGAYSAGLRKFVQKELEIEALGSGQNSSV